VHGFDGHGDVVEHVVEAFEQAAAFFQHVRVLVRDGPEKELAQDVAQQRRGDRPRPLQLQQHLFQQLHAFGVQLVVDLE
jgi:hypothetical protein